MNKSSKFLPGGPSQTPRQPPAVSLGPCRGGQPQWLRPCGGRWQSCSSWWRSRVPGSSVTFSGEKNSGFSWELSGVELVFSALHMSMICGCFLNIQIWWKNGGIVLGRKIVGALVFHVFRVFVRGILEARFWWCIFFKESGWNVTQFCWRWFLSSSCRCGLFKMTV